MSEIFPKKLGYLWFLLTIIGFYISVPLVRRITQDEKLLPYFILICISAIILRSIKLEFVHFLGKSIIIAPIFSFVLGYYLSECKNISVKTELALYALGIAGYLSMVLPTAYFSCIDGKTVIKYSDDSILATGIAMFVFFKCHVAKMNFSQQVISIIQFLSSHTLGIYLVHVACLCTIHRYILPIDSFNPLCSIPIVAIITFVVLLVITVL